MNTRENPTPRSFPQIAATLGRRLRRNTFFRCIALIEGYALMATAAIMAVNASVALSLPGWLIGLGPTGIAVAASLAVTLRTNASPERVFHDADAAYDYHHLLPTAFGLWKERAAESAPEAARRNDDRDLREVVIRRGSAQAQHLRPRTVYPPTLPARFYLLPLGTLACLIVLLAVHGLSQPDQPNSWAGYIQEFRNQSNRIARRSEALRDEEGVRLAGQLEELSETLESRPDEKEIERRLEELLPRLEEHMRNLGASDLVAGEQSGRATLEGESEGTGSLRARRVEGGAGRGMDIGPARPDEPDEAVEGGERPTPPDRADGKEGDAAEDEATPRGVAPTEDPEAGHDRERDEMERELQAARDHLRDLADQLSEEESDADGESGGEAENPRMAERDRGGEASPDGEDERDEDDGSSARGTGDEAGLGRSPDPADDPSPPLDDVVRRMIELPSSDKQTSFTELFSRETPGTPESSLPEGTVNSEFRRQVEAAVGGSTVPAELQGYVRDYFLRIAGRAAAGAPKRGAEDGGD